MLFCQQFSKRKGRKTSGLDFKSCVHLDTEHCTRSIEKDSQALLIFLRFDEYISRKHKSNINNYFIHETNDNNCWGNESSHGWLFTDRLQLIVLTESDLPVVYVERLPTTIKN